MSLIIFFKINTLEEASAAVAASFWPPSLSPRADPSLFASAPVPGDELTGESSTSGSETDDEGPSDEDEPELGGQQRRPGDRDSLFEQVGAPLLERLLAMALAAAVCFVVSEAATTWVSKWLPGAFVPLGLVRVAWILLRCVCLLGSMHWQACPSLPNSLRVHELPLIFAAP